MKKHFIHLHVFTDALALRCALEARLRTQLVERKGEGGEHTGQIGRTLLHILYMRKVRECYDLKNTSLISW